MATRLTERMICPVSDGVYSRQDLVFAQSAEGNRAMADAIGRNLCHLPRMDNRFFAIRVVNRIPVEVLDEAEYNAVMGGAHSLSPELVPASEMDGVELPAITAADVLPRSPTRNWGGRPKKNP